ncbi:hypothetical protein DFH09DRAFT_1347058 [Mycena vulgaris]|nr:hypothetical protein DFH09DRAFT_1347058 [Mycena vulgaris]
MSDPPDINVDSATTHDLRGLGSSAILLSSVRSFYIDYFLEDTDLGLCLPGESVFPNLEKLHWSPRKPPEGFHHVRMFLTPGIKILRLGPITTISHLSVLSTLAVKCPSLKEVDITVDEIEYEALPMISTFVRGLRCTTSLDVPGLDDSAFAYLSKLPDLRSLELHYPYMREYSFRHGGLSDFPAFTKFLTPTMEMATSLLSTFSKQAFTTVSIHSNSPAVNPTHIVAGSFYSALGKHCSHSSVREINVDGGYFRTNTTAQSTQQQHALYAVGIDILHPLLSFANLVNLDLVHPVGFDIDDAAIVAMARAWPCIEVLCLTASPFRHVTPRVTLEGLYALAKYCSALHMLELTFDATVVPPLRDNTKKRVGQDALVFLDVGPSPITKKTRRIAKFLATIFPELMEIETLYSSVPTGGEESDDETPADPQLKTFHKRWGAVEDALHNYRPGPPSWALG